MNVLYILKIKENVCFWPLKNGHFL